jgi:RimJ/RimL family protein N-acetyltransferase
MMEGNRLELVKYTGLEDFHYFSCIVFNESIMNMNMGRIFTQEEAEEYFDFMIENDKRYDFAGNYKVFIENNNIYIGTATLRLSEDLLGAEIEYMLLPDYWGKGYGTEIVGCLLNLVSKYESVKEIIAITDPNNIGSRKVLLKNGFESNLTYKVEEDDRIAEKFIKYL